MAWHTCCSLSAGAILSLSYPTLNMFAGAFSISWDKESPILLNLGENDRSFCWTYSALISKGSDLFLKALVGFGVSKSMGTVLLLTSMEDHSSSEFSRLTWPNIGSSSLLQNHHLREYLVRRITIVNNESSRNYEYKDRCSSINIKCSGMLLC